MHRDLQALGQRRRGGAVGRGHSGGERAVECEGAIREQMDRLDDGLADRQRNCKQAVAGVGGRQPRRQRGGRVDDLRDVADVLEGNIEVRFGAGGDAQRRGR